MNCRTVSHGCHRMASGSVCGKRASTSRATSMLVWKHIHAMLMREATSHDTLPAVTHSLRDLRSSQWNWSAWARVLLTRPNTTLHGGVSAGFMNADLRPSPHVTGQQQRSQVAGPRPASRAGSA